MLDTKKIDITRPKIRRTVIEWTLAYRLDFRANKCFVTNALIICDLKIVFCSGDISAGLFTQVCNGMAIHDVKLFSFFDPEPILLLQFAAY
jgi:hypothetical protein